MVVQKFLDRRYEEEVLNEHFNKVDRIEWKELFTKKKRNKSQNSTINNIQRNAPQYIQNCEQTQEYSTSKHWIPGSISS